MHHFATRILLFCSIFISAAAEAQFSLDSITELGNVNINMLQYESERKGWLLSDGYSVWESKTDFSEPQLLYNSYPAYQFAMHRLPNGNIFSRRFDYAAAVFDAKTSYRKLDSAAIYMTNKNQFAHINPASFLRVRKWASGTHAQYWAMNQCFTWSIDSVTVCRESVVGFSKKIAGRDSTVLYTFKDAVMGFEVDAMGSIALVGTKDSGWYFISDRLEQPYFSKHITPGNRSSKFYINEAKHQIWVQEENFAPGLAALRLYDYSSGLPVHVKDLLPEDLGLGAYTRYPQFCFDWENEKLYLSSGSLNLIRVDVKTYKPDLNFYNLLLQSNIASIDALTFEPESGSLYMAASKFERETGKNKAFIFRLKENTENPIPVIQAKDIADANQFYKPGMHTVTQENISAISKNTDPSLASNGLAVIPLSKSQYQLYNLPAGKQIQAFPSFAANHEREFASSGQPAISPNGKYIFDRVVKPAITYHLPDTFYLALADLKTGKISRKTWVPAAGAYDSRTGFIWNKNDLPIFITKQNIGLDSIRIETLGFDQQLNKTTLHSWQFAQSQEEIIYQIWSVGEEGNLLYKTNSGSNNKGYDYYFYDSRKKSTEVLYRDIRSDVDFYSTQSGFLLAEKSSGSSKLHWHDLHGKLIHSSPIDLDTYHINTVLMQEAIAFLYNQNQNTIHKIDLENGSLDSIEAKVVPGLNFVVSPDGKYVLNHDETSKVWQMEGRRLFQLNQTEDHKNFIKQTQYTANYLVSDGRVWNLQTGMLDLSSLYSIAILRDSIGLSTEIASALLEEAGRDENFETEYKLRTHENNFLENFPNHEKLFNWAYAYNKQIIVTKNIHTNEIKSLYSLPFSPDNLSSFQIYPIPNKNFALIVKKGSDYISSGVSTDSAVILNLSTGKKSSVLSAVIPKIYSLSNTLSFFAQDVKTGLWELYFTENGIIKPRPHRINFNTDSTGIGYIMDEEHIAIVHDKGLTVWNINSLEKRNILFRYHSENYVESSFLFYDPSTTNFYVGYSDGGVLRVEHNKVEAVNRPVESIAGIVGKQHQHILMIDKKGDYHFIHEKSLEADLHLYTSEGLSFTDRKYLWLTKENYYMASPGAENQIHFASEQFIIPLKQADITYNRPDKVLEYLKAPPKNIELYSRLHNLRERKYSRATVQQSQPISIQVQNSISGKSVLFQVEASAEQNINKIHFTVNGCPLTVPVQSPAKRINQSVTIPLNAGKNKIYCWVEDQKGNRSRMLERSITGEFEDEGRWYFLGIGVSTYKDSTQNLRYADKDIRDISRFLAGKYPGIEIDSLLNEAVTIENIREKLKKYQHTNPDDKIIISISGHGLLDSAKQFWYACHDVDFNNPAQNGLSIQMLTQWFDSIPARYRLVTLDACHSGEVLDLKTSGIESVNMVKDDTTANIKGNVLLGKKNKYRPSSELLTTMQLLFSDQLSNTGINLLAASSGTEFALEGNQWGNGVFTHVLLEGWAYAAREKSYNSAIHYRNLKNYVQKRVSAITKGRQTPNTLMENGEIDWWLVE